MHDCFFLSYFLSDCKVKEPSSLAKDVELAKKLWDKSVEMVGIKDYDMFNSEDTLPEPLKDIWTKTSQFHTQIK